MQILCEFHWWPHKEGVNLFHETQRWSVSTFFEFQSNGGEGEGCEAMGESSFQMNLVNTWKNMEFKGNTHVVIPHSKMQLLKGKTKTLQK